MSLMGIDVGTTGVKAVAFDEKGRILSQAYREYPLLNPIQGYYELDSELVWRFLSNCLQEVNANPAVLSDPVTVLAISSQGEAVIPISKDRKVLANSPVSSDRRSLKQSQELVSALGIDQVYEITGQTINAKYPLSKILWWQRETPEIFSHTWKFLCYGDYIVMKLGLDPVIDYTMAARTLAFDIHQLDWSEAILNKVGLSRTCFADISPSGTVVGTISKNISKELGFLTRVYVVTGGHDQPCGALGAGVTQLGEAMYSIGTTECVAPVVAKPHEGLKTIEVSCYPHVILGKFIIITGSQTGGRLLRWYKDEFGYKETVKAQQIKQSVYDIIVDQIPSDPSNLMVLPHFAGSGTAYNDPYSKGAILGLTFNTRRADIIKAILEGITYEQAVNIEQLREAGVDVHRLRAVGGGSRSRAWMQIKADILNTPIVSMTVSEASSLGAAMLAGWALGTYSSLNEAVARLVSEKEVFTPDLSKSKVYQEKLKIYQQTYLSLREVNQLI